MIKYSELSLGQIEAIGNKLGGMDGIHRFLADELVVMEKASLKPVISEPREFPVFLEIEVGGKSKDELLAEIDANGMFASDYAKDIMSKDAWKPGERETVRFAKVKVGELGFTKQPTTTELWNRIEELGHSLCEPADGPTLRREFKDQPRGTVCWTAMKQISASGGRPVVFELERNDDGEAWLGGGWTNPGNEWSLDDEVVFRLRKGK